MSRAWANGSTRAWRRLRLAVLTRDNWTCQLCGQPINPALRTPHPRSATVHHTIGKQYGDNPKHLVAAHRECNQRAGDPNRHDPRPRTVTPW